MKNISLQRQVSLRLIPILLILWICTGGIILKLVSDKTYELLDSSLKETAERILPLALLDIEQRAKINDEIELVPLPLNDENLSYQIQNKFGKTLLRSHKSPLENLGKLSQGFSQNYGMRIFGSSSEDGAYEIYVFEPMAHRQETLYSILFYFLIPFLLIVPISYIAIKFALRFLPTQLKEYSNQLASVTHGELKAINLSGLPSELLEVGRSVNTLIDRLKEILSKERAFSENIAHELRTPIAIAMAQLDVLGLNTKDENSTRRILKIKNSLLNLEQMIKRFLQIARAESISSQTQTKTSLEEINQHVINQLITKNNRHYQVELIQPVEDVLVDADALGIILMNLLENAHQYATPGTPIKILIGPHSQIRIQNKCAELTSSAISQIMERYQRGNHRSFGLGIGLSIVKMLAEQSGGNLTLESPIPGEFDGVQVSVMWPKTEK